MVFPFQYKIHTFLAGVLEWWNIGYQHSNFKHTCFMVEKGYKINRVLEYFQDAVFVFNIILVILFSFTSSRHIGY